MSDMATPAGVPSRKRARNISPLNSSDPPTLPGIMGANPLLRTPNVPAPINLPPDTENRYLWITLMGSQIAQLHASSARKEAPYYATWTYLSLACLTHILANETTTLLTTVYPQHPVSMVIDSTEDDEIIQGTIVNTPEIATIPVHPSDDRDDLERGESDDEDYNFGDGDDGDGDDGDGDHGVEDSGAEEGDDVADNEVEASDEAIGNDEGSSAGGGNNLSEETSHGDTTARRSDGYKSSNANLSQAEETRHAHDTVTMVGKKAKPPQRVRFGALPEVSSSPSEDPLYGFSSSPVQAALARGSSRARKEHRSSRNAASLSSDPLNLFKLSSPQGVHPLPRVVARQSSSRLFDDLPPSDPPIASPVANTSHAGVVDMDGETPGSTPNPAPNVQRLASPEPPAGSQPSGSRSSQSTPRTPSSSPRSAVMKPSRFESTRYPDFLQYLTLAKYDESDRNIIPQVEELLDERVCLIEEIKRPLDPKIIDNWAQHANLFGPLGQAERYQVSIQAHFVFNQDTRLKRIGAIIAFGHWFHYREYSREQPTKLEFDWAEYSKSDTPSDDSEFRGKLGARLVGNPYLPRVDQLVKYFDNYGLVRLGTPEASIALELIRQRTKVIHKSVFRRIHAGLGNAAAALEEGESWDEDEDEEQGDNASEDADYYAEEADNHGDNEDHDAMQVHED